MSSKKGLNFPLPKLLGLATLNIFGGNVPLKLPFNEGLIIKSFLNLVIIFKLDERMLCIISV